MESSSDFKLEIATLEDVPALTEVWYAGFTTPDILRLWPDTPGVRKWWDDAHRHDITNKPFQLYVKLVDPEAVDDQGRARIVAWAKWDLGMLEERGPRYPPWHDEMPAEEVDEFIGKLDGQRRRVMGEQKHYYLDMLVTHPDYHRRGAGSTLVKWGCDVADKDGVGAYVDASKDGAPLYARFGFIDKSEPGSGNIAPMARGKSPSSI